MVDPVTGKLTTNKSLDHEVRDSYMLQVRALGNEGSDTKKTTRKECTCAVQSLVLVYINVTNKNDFPPTFTHAVYNACKFPRNTFQSD